MTTPERRADGGPSVATILRAAAKRFLGLLLAVAGGTTLVSLALGLAVGGNVARSLSLGYYIVGSFLLIAGFFVGNRGPIRVRGEPGFGMFGFARNRQLRWATGAEQVESLSLSFVFVALGFALVVLGAAVDPRYSLV